MHSSLAIAVLLVVLTTACTHEDDGSQPSETLPSAVSSGTTTTTPLPEPEPSPTCDWPRNGEVSSIGSGFVAELNIMSGNPNPAWLLSKADGAELRRLVKAGPEELDLDGPDELGGYGVTADGPAVEFLAGLDLPSRFWVLGDGEIARFLASTLPCTSPAAEAPGARQTDCELVEFDGRTYRRHPQPPETGPGVGRILGQGRTGRCPDGAGGTTTVYSVNEMDPDEAITISDGGVVAVFVSEPSATP